MDSEGYNPKQAREQKVRRDRRRKDNRRPGDAPGNVECESVSSAPKGQREASSRARERRPPPANEPKKPASEAAVAENAEPPELPDFSNLKRETDDIAALTSKKYSKRQVFSNWTRYENPPEVQSEEEDSGRRTDFESLAHLPASAGGHFKFKSEQSWDVNPSSLYAEYFSVNVESLVQGLACIPLYDKLELPKDLLSAEEVERIDYFAKQSAARFNVTKASMKEGTYTQDTNNHINKILNILSYKENQASNKTDPSMYENVDEDDQLENKSLVQFSFETSSTEHGGTSVEVCLPARGLSSKKNTASKDTEPPAHVVTVPAVTQERSEPAKVSLSNGPSDTSIASVVPGQNHLPCDVKEEVLDVPSKTDAGEGNNASRRGDQAVEVQRDDATAWEEEKATVEEPVILEQRTGKGKKGSARGKSKKDEKKVKIEENNNVVNPKLATKESADLVSNSCTQSVENIVVTEVVKPPVGRTVAQLTVKDDVKKNDVKCSHDVEVTDVQGILVEKENEKPNKQRKTTGKEIEKPVIQVKVVDRESANVQEKTVESKKQAEQVPKKSKADATKKSPRVDDDLDFLLSLKKPVEDVKPKIATSQVARSAIDDDETDDPLSLVQQRASEENLEDWLDSMLDD